MEIKNFNEQIKVWEIEFKLRELIAAVNNTPGQDYLNVQELEEKVKKLQEDQAYYKQKIKDDTYKIIQPGELIKVESSDGVSGVKIEYYQVTEHNEDRNLFYYNLLTVFRGEYENKIEYKVKEYVTTDELCDYLKYKKIEKGPEVKTEFDHYMEVLKNA